MENPKKEKETTRKKKKQLGLIISSCQVVNSSLLPHVLLQFVNLKLLRDRPYNIANLDNT